MPQQPLYRHVIDTLIGRIASGALPAGAMLPSETQLGAEFGVSQGTARKALMELERRGLVERAQGRGTFVTLRTPERSLFHFFRLRRESGAVEQPQLETERVSQRDAHPAEAAALFGKPDQVIEIDRIRSLGGRRIIHEASVVSASLFPGLAARAPLPNALYAFFQQAYSCTIIRAEERISAAQLSAPEAAALQLPPGAAALQVERRGLDILDRVVELRRSLYATEAYSYHVVLE